MEYQFTPTPLQSTAHELRTPLTVILSYTQLLRNQAYGSLTLEQQVALEKIEANCRTMTTVINQTLSEMEARTYH